MPPPKPEPKKKTRKELRAEAEAAARAAEEERLAQEEEARRVADQVEQRRQELLAAFLASRDARLGAERSGLAARLQQMRAQRGDAEAQHAAAAEWAAFCSCDWLPDPRLRPAMNAFLHSLQDTTPAAAAPGSGGGETLEGIMQQCEACVSLAQQCRLLAAKDAMAAQLAACTSTLACGPGSSSSSPDSISTPRPQTAAAPDGSSAAAEASGSEAATSAADADTDPPGSIAVAATAAATEPTPLPGASGAAAAAAASTARAAQYEQDAAALCASVDRLLDAATAHILLHSDEHADDKGDVLLTAQRGELQLGLWANVHKNPRFKLVDFTGLGMSVEVPKQLALANIALHVQRRPFASVRTRAAAASPGSCLVPLGGELVVQLLALPPPAKHSGGWTVHQVSPQLSKLTALPYPIPPLGADPSTWQPDEPPPPLTFSMRQTSHLLVPAAVRVGWWDASQGQWSEEGVSGVSYDAATARLTFSTTHLGCLALLHDTTAHLPYSAWTIRPTGGLGGSTATIDVQVPGLPANSSGDQAEGPGGSLSLEVGSGWARLVAPAMPQLGHLVGKQLPPWELLEGCSACGLQLAPGSREAAHLGLQEKDAAAEAAMCADVALLCTSFLVASSRWNSGAGADSLLVRLSEVTDWEEGGRTSTQAAARIFSKEAASGPRQVLVARRKGALGVALVDGGDRREQPPALPDMSSVEGVQAASQDTAAWLHASLLHLLSEHRRKQQQQQPVTGAATGSSGGGDADTPASSDEDSALGGSSPAALALGEPVDAGFVGSMTQVLQALQLFSFA